ncbi:MAG: hypothetical protein AB1714_05080 [Acidobacteriota bacterium]
MFKARAVAITLTCLLAGIGCSKKSTDEGAPSTPAEPQQAAPQQQSPQPGNPMEAIQQMGQAMQQMQQGDMKPVPPIDFHKLKDALPNLDGWTREEPKGESATFGQWSYSDASTTYTKGESRLDCKIFDYAHIHAMYAPFMLMFAGNFSHETDDGYEKSVTVGGNPGFERWEKGNKSGELTLWIGKRLIVTVEGEKIPDTSVLQELAKAVDYSKIGPL